MSVHRSKRLIDAENCRRCVKGMTGSYDRGVPCKRLIDLCDCISSNNEALIVESCVEVVVSIIRWIAA